MKKLLFALLAFTFMGEAADKRIVLLEELGKIEVLATIIGLLVEVHGPNANLPETNGQWGALPEESRHPKPVQRPTRH